jgi:hypothetical protein
MGRQLCSAFGKRGPTVCLREKFVPPVLGESVLLLGFFFSEFKTWVSENKPRVSKFRTQVSEFRTRSLGIQDSGLEIQASGLEIRASGLGIESRASKFRPRVSESEVGPRNSGLGSRNPTEGDICTPHSQRVSFAPHNFCRMTRDFSAQNENKCIQAKYNS